ncbi:MAG: calcium-binding protein, partial [Pseudomonadota bacterium]
MTNLPAPSFVLDHSTGEVTLYGNVAWDWLWSPENAVSTGKTSLYALQMAWAGSIFDPTFSWPDFQDPDNFPFAILDVPITVVVQDLNLTIEYVKGDDLTVLAAQYSEDDPINAVMGPFAQSFFFEQGTVESSYALGLQFDPNGTELQSVTIQLDVSTWLAEQNYNQAPYTDTYVGFHATLGTDLVDVFGTEYIAPASAGADWLHFGDLSAMVIAHGAQGDDTVTGGRGNDTLSGGRGDDQVFGQSGDDSLRGGLGSDTIKGGLGNDELFGNRGDDVMRGGPGNDSLSGGVGDDTVDGGAGNDILLGGAGKDILRDGHGSDVMSGGWGEDEFVLVADGEFDEIVDFKVDSDVINVNAWEGASSFNLLTINHFLGGAEVQYGSETVLVWYDDTVGASTQ